MDQADADDAILANVLSELEAFDLAPVEQDSQAHGAWCMPGFTGKSRVATSFGDLPIEALRLRDTLRTISGSFLPVKFLDKVHLENEFLSQVPEAKPVWVRANALGKGMPNKDLMISRHQRVNLSHTPQNAKTIEQLLSRLALPAAAQDTVTYYLFHCGEPAMVQVDGIWCLTEP
ncbi:MAG: Hint domain-containing protein [Rhodobacter sp.]|nr:Hint domain-containing protein [Rhodobacter sp.]